MKKNDIKIYDECGCEVWTEALVRELFTRAKIQTEQVVIYDMDDRRIHIRAEVWDETLEPDAVGEEPGGWVDRDYTIRYYDDGRFFGILFISFRFFDNERVVVEEKISDGKIRRFHTPQYLDAGAYVIISCLGKAKCIRQKF